MKGYCGRKEGKEAGKRQRDREKGRGRRDGGKAL